MEKKSSKRKREKTNLQFIEEYGKYLLDRNYSLTTISACLTRTKQFCTNMSELFRLNYYNEDSFKSLNQEDLILYENYLLRRITKKEIKEETAYSCIKNVRLFLQFLSYKKVIDFKYKIPRKFLVQPARSNSFIPKEMLIEIINSVLNEPTDLKYKNLALLLLFIDTGCRPIEASNVKLRDLNLTEKKVSLYCVKSGKRTLVLSDMVIKVLKRYIKVREFLTPKCDSLFITSNGKPATSKHLTYLIVKMNKQAFGKCAINATALRHTYITNAIENRNEFKEVSEAVGHRHWVSTHHYLHRSKKRLILNTIGFDPMKYLEGDY